MLRKITDTQNVFEPSVKNNGTFEPFILGYNAATKKKDQKQPKHILSGKEQQKQHQATEGKTKQYSKMLYFYVHHWI